MEISDAGEFALIERLRRRLSARLPDAAVKAIGDDCAILRPREGVDLVWTVDAAIEGVHFDRRWFTPFQIGWKSMAGNLSDIAAMGGVPVAALVSLACPAALTVAEFDELYDGLSEVADRFELPIVGGNLASSPGGLSVHITVVGEVERARAVLRSGAQPGDEIWVTGHLGQSHAGLQLAKRPEIGGGPGREELLKRHRQPAPRVREAQFLVQNVAVHSMIDLSDGLSSDLAHLCEESGVGAEIFADRIPLCAGTREVAGQLDQDPLDFALNGGEDFELCFTAPEGAMTEVADSFRSRFGLCLTTIGAITDADGACLTSPDGARVQLAPGGYDHFQKVD